VRWQLIVDDVDEIASICTRANLSHDIVVGEGDRHPPVNATGLLGSGVSRSQLRSDRPRTSLFKRKTCEYSDLQSRSRVKCERPQNPPPPPPGSRGMGMA
jgi:hypothetical protein